MPTRRLCARASAAAAGLDRPRLAYRDVASATNRTTLIAAIVPARTVTVHTVFCLQSRLALDAQRVLCALLNSYVANYLVQAARDDSRHGGHHRPASGSARHRARRPGSTSSAAWRRRSSVGDDPVAAARAQAAAAEAYGLASEDLAHVLGDFSAGPCRPARVGDRGLRQANAATKLAMSSASTMLV